MRNILILLLVCLQLTNLFSFDLKKHMKERERIFKRIEEMEKELDIVYSTINRMRLFRKIMSTMEETKKYTYIKITKENKNQIRREIYEIAEEDCIDVKSKMRVCLHIAKSFEVIKNYERSFSLYNFACMTRKSGIACHNVAIHFLQYNKKIEFETANYFFTLACMNGHKDSCKYTEKEELLNQLNNYDKN